MAEERTGMRPCTEKEKVEIEGKGTQTRIRISLLVDRYIFGIHRIHLQMLRLLKCQNMTLNRLRPFKRSAESAVINDMKRYIKSFCEGPQM